MPNLMVYIEDKIRDVYQRVLLDVDTSADLLVRKLVEQFGLPRYDFSVQQIEYWLERPDEKKRPGRGKRLPGHITLREAGITRGDLLQLVSPEGRRVWVLIQKILDEIAKKITDKVSGKLKEKVTEEVWKRVKEKLVEIERTRADDKRVQLVRKWVNSVDRIGGPIKLIDIIEKSIDAYKRYGPLVKVATVLAPVLLIVLATLLQPSSAEPPVTPIVFVTPTPLPPQPTIPVATLKPTPIPTMTSTPMPTSTPTSSPTMTVSPVVNHAPVADGQSISTDQDTAANITLIARDEDGQALTFNIVSSPSNGTLSGVLPNLIYMPNRGFSGFDSFTFKANDGQADSNIAIVNIAVRANTPPVANDDIATTDQDMAIPINVMANDFDSDGDPLTVISVTQGIRGTVIDNGNGPVIYRPHPGFFGQDTFTYTISDSKGGTGTATVLVTVNPAPNLLPIAADDTTTTDQDTEVTINVLTNDFDPDGDPLTVISVTQGIRGTVIDNGNGPVIYRPHPGFIGQDTFTYTISDSKGAADTATVFVTVNSVLADLAVTQADSLDPLAIGDDLTYEIRIINSGPATATGVTMSDQLPSIALFRSATPSQGTCSQEKGVVTCQIGDLTAAAEATIRIAVTMGQGQDQAQVVTNIVNVKGNQSDPESGNNASLEDTTVNPPDPADLVVTTLQTTNRATINAEGQIEVPIRLVVKNQGGTEAGIFKVSTEYTGPNGTFVVAFTVPDQHDIWYPYTNAPLSAESEVAFAGTVIFRSALQGETVSLTATADSCSGDEFMPSYCRVDEGNEDNNRSVSISVPLPKDSSGPPDLEVIISTPDSGLAGSDIRVNAQVQNMGNGLAPGTSSSGSNGYMVDIVLSSDTDVPPGWAIYSPNYSEDVLLRGGRISNTSDLAPGQAKSYQGYNNGLPADTPSGYYYVCARVDPGGVVTESSEGNNVSCTPIQIESQPYVK